MATAPPPQQALDVGSAQDARASSSASSSSSASGSGGNVAGSSGLARNGSSRKAQKRGHPSEASNGDGQHAVTTGSSQSGPPYICGTCQTSYSRLEYLRRHERRHADIRPFGCDCGKSFSRSDVLSRHKRQCAVALGGELPEPPAAAAPAKEAKARKSSTSTPARSRKPSTAEKSSRGGSQRGSESQPGAPALDASRASPSADSGHFDGRPSSQAMATTSSGFGPPPPHLNHHAAAAAAAAVAAGSIVPPPPYGGGEVGFETRPPHMAGPGGFGLPGMPQPVHAQVSALNAYAQHPAYPSSPESSGSINGSQHSSPRFGARDMARSGSGRFSLRKGGSFNLPQDFWDQASDSSKASPGGGPPSRHGSLSFSSRAAPSATGGAALSGAGLSMPWSGAGPSNGSAYAYSSANEFGGSAATSSSESALRGGLDGPAPSTSTSSQGTTVSSSTSNPHNHHLGTLPPRGEPQRFSIPSGPLSPFSSIALNSTMSPYLSAFSNARDTPLVASPNRTGGLPGTLTPGGSSASLNVFDWTMRPPVKTPTGGATTHSSSGATTTPTSSARRGSNAAGAQGTKRKREGGEDDSPTQVARNGGGNKGSIDIDSKSAAELLDSLRTAGAAPKAGATSGNGAAPGSADGASASLVVKSEGDALGTSASTTGLRGGAAGSAGDSSSSVAGTASVRALHTGNGSDGPGAGGAGALTSRPASESMTSLTKTDEQATMLPASGPSAEAFLLRSTGGIQEPRAGLAGLEGAPSTSYETAPGVASALAITPSSAWDPANFGLPTPTGGAMNSSAAMGWLLSPSIHQLITSFNGGALPPSGPGDGGSYFAGALGPSVSEGGGNALPIGMTPAAISTADGVLATPAVLKNYSTDFPFTPFLQGAAAGGDNPAMNAFMAAATAAAAPPKAEPQPGSLQQQDNAPSQAEAQQDPPYGNDVSSPIGNIALEKALTDVQNPFYIPPQMFRACYSVSHWTLPPITRLSMLALHAQSNLLKHMPILHEPTFRLDTTPGCLAFAICMLGCHEAGRRWWAGEEIAPRPQGLPGLKTDDVASSTKSHLDELDGQPLVKPLVMTEKMNYLMKSFAGSVKTEKDQVSVVQALMLFQSNNFLSSDPGIRAIAAASHGAVVCLARKAGFYNPGATHSQREIKYSPDDVVRTTLNEARELSYAYSFLPNYLPSCPDEEKLWRRWSDLAGRRRTAFLIMVMDTVASLDAGLPTELTLEEVAHLPLPSPDTIWRAPNAASWRKALDQYRGPTFGESISDLLCSHEDDAISHRNPYGVPVFGKHGPFARLVMVVALLRGIIHLVDGRTRKVSKPSPLQPWLRNIALRGSKGAEVETDFDAEAAVYHRALNRWRRAWDDDELCRPKPTAGGPYSTDPSHVIFTARTASGATPLCDDALPFYWLCRVLLQYAAPELAKAETPTPTVPQTLIAAVGARADAADGRRNSTETSPDFRTLLRLAKAFVNQGETNLPPPAKGADGGASNGLDSLATVAASA